MAIILSLLSSLMWGASDFAGGLMSKRYPAMVIVAWSSTFGLLMATVAVALTTGWHGPYAWLPWGMAAGAAGALGLICYYYALSHGTMGVVAPVTSLGIIVPVVIGIARGRVAEHHHHGRHRDRDRRHRADQRPGVQRRRLAQAGHRRGAGRACSSASSSCSWTPAPRTARCSPCGRCGPRSRAPSSWSRSSGVPPGESRASTTLYIAAIAAGDLGANLTFGIASTKGYVSITSVLASLFPVVTVLLARFVLHERLRRIQIVGVVVTMVGVAFIAAG